MNRSRIFGSIKKLPQGDFGAFEDFFGGFEGTGGGDFPHDALVEESVAVLAEAHGFDAHALGGDACVNRSAVTDCDAFFGIATVVDVREVFACDFKTFGVDAEGATAVLE